MLNSNKMDFHIYFSNQNYRGIGSDLLGSLFSKNERNKMHNINHVLINNNIIWQRGVIHTLITEKFDNVILLGDMKILSNWIAILICRLKGKKLVFGHMGFMEMRIF